jgi:hypothetical protein
VRRDFDEGFGRHFRVRTAAKRRAAADDNTVVDSVMHPKANSDMAPTREAAVLRRHLESAERHIGVLIRERPGGRSIRPDWWPRQARSRLSWRSSGASRRPPRSPSGRRTLWAPGPSTTQLFCSSSVVSSRTIASSLNVHQDAQRAGLNDDWYEPFPAPSRNGVSYLHPAFQRPGSVWQ